jgi:hypothetical protein
MRIVGRSCLRITTGCIQCEQQPDEQPDDDEPPTDELLRDVSPDSNEPDTGTPVAASRGRASSFSELEATCVGAAGGGVSASTCERDGSE